MNKHCPAYLNWSGYMCDYYVHINRSTLTQFANYIKKIKLGYVGIICVATNFNFFVCSVDLERFVVMWQLCSLKLMQHVG